MKKRKKNTTLIDKHLMETMSDFQLARWLALFEGVNLVADKADKEGKAFVCMNIKQPALEDYVDSTSILIYRELTGKELIK